MHLRSRGALVFAALAAALSWPARAGAAAAPRVAAVSLPSRSPDAPALAARLPRLGAELARARGGVLDDGGAEGREVADLSATLARAEELAAAGALDEAARMLDEAIEAAARAPHRFAQTGTLAAAHVTRASIALARGEAGRADALLERLLRWDPSFTLGEAERAPRLVAALEAARARLGELPALRAEELGRLCELDEVIVGRPLGGGRVELSRATRCKVVARVVLGVDEIDDGALPLLGVDLPPPRRDPGRRATPLHKSGWFWAVAGAVVLGAGALIVWQAADDGDLVDVVPHL